MLTEREKQTLRLIVRGHDAKSIARTFGLSVHTINERLRDARRKLTVSSSREAARLLADLEDTELASAAPKPLGDMPIGEDRHGPGDNARAAPIGGAQAGYRLPVILVGACLMIVAFSLLALAALPQSPTSVPATASASQISTPEVTDAAREWLTLGDQGRWEDGYRTAGASFRKVNTVRGWAEVSEHVRVPLGAVVSRLLVSQETIASPEGYQVVKFRTRFADRGEIMEVVTLHRENGRWRVIGAILGTA